MNENKCKGFCADTITGTICFKCQLERIKTRDKLRVYYEDESKKRIAEEEQEDEEIFKDFCRLIDRYKKERGKLC